MPPNHAAMMRIVQTLATLATAAAHSAMTIPEPRNAVDSDQMPWGGAVPHPLPFEPCVLSFGFTPARSLRASSARRPPVRCVLTPLRRARC